MIKLDARYFAESVVKSGGGSIVGRVVVVVLVSLRMRNLNLDLSVGGLARAAK